MYGNLPVFQVPRGDAIKEKHGGPVKMASGGALQKVMQEVLGKYRVKGRNALLLPPARDLGGNFNFDRALAQSLQEAAGSKVNLETGSSVAPLWLHGQRAASGLGSIPSNLRNATKKQGPLYFTDNPLIATTAEYATDSPQFDDAQRFLWPYLLADGAVPTVQKSKGEWRSGLDRLDEQLEGFGQGTMDWTTMLYALKEANRLDPGSVPDNLIFKGIMDVGPGTKGTGFEMSKQNQMMLRTPRSLVENGGLLPIFDDAQPWKHGGLVQYARSRA